ncbi:MAG: hypothetical protein LBS89_01835 [Zoogloeaceae bacterium]|jgi:hypothetical protein|nr:hypothetical protein [Zoogloeaceae bacterium]
MRKGDQAQESEGGHHKKQFCMGSNDQGRTGRARACEQEKPRHRVAMRAKNVGKGGIIMNFAQTLRQLRGHVLQFSPFREGLNTFPTIRETLNNSKQGNSERLQTVQAEHVEALDFTGKALRHLFRANGIDQRFLKHVPYCSGRAPFGQVQGERLEMFNSPFVVSLSNHAQEQAQGERADE